MSLSVETFRTKVRNLAQKYFPEGKLESQEENPFRLKMRIILSSKLFIDLFYSKRTERIDFALIEEENRIYGIDNLHGWHHHPFGKVQQHQPIDEPTLEKIFSDIKGIMVQRNLLK